MLDHNRERKDIAWTLLTHRLTLKFSLLICKLRLTKNCVDRTKINTSELRYLLNQRYKANDSYTNFKGPSLHYHLPTAQVVLAADNTDYISVEG